jgi:hypothetical protein
MKVQKAYNVWGLIFCGAMVALFGFALLRSIYFHLVSKSWQPVAATVVAIENRAKSAELRYVFRFNGEELTGNTFCFLSAGSINDKLLINVRCRVGSEIEVYVNPNQSVVEQRSLRFTHLWVHLLIVGFSGIMTASCWCKLRAGT